MGIMDKLKRSKAMRKVEAIAEPPKTARNIKDEETKILIGYQAEIKTMRSFLLDKDIPDDGIDFINNASKLALSILGTVILNGRSTEKQDKAILNCYRGVKKWYDSNQNTGYRETKRQTKLADRNQFAGLLGEL
jgi:hypothetical protein